VHFRTLDQGQHHVQKVYEYQQDSYDYTVAASGHGIPRQAISQQPQAEVRTGLVTFAGTGIRHNRLYLLNAN
jgi:diacylglycerol kinase family enzyme